MAKIVSPPKPKRVKCESCRATIEYLPEDVDTYEHYDYGGGTDMVSRVKCPREGCKEGYGYVG